MATKTLEGTARALVAPAKGILAADAARAGEYTAELERSVR